MASVDFKEIRRELCIFLRNNITDPSSRITEASQSFSGNGSTKTFTITQTGVVSVKSITVTSVSKAFGTDYSVSYGNEGGTTTITFVDAPIAGTNNIVVTYRYGKNWIYPDFPKQNLSTDSFPRVAITFTNGTIRPLGIGISGTMSKLLLSVSFFDKSDSEVSSLVESAKTAILANFNNFYYFKTIYPVALSPFITFKDGNTQILYQTMDLEIPLVYES